MRRQSIAGSRQRTRELYVGLTRHRQEAWLVIERKRLAAAVRVRQPDLVLVLALALALALENEGSSTA